MSKQKTCLNVQAIIFDMDGVITHTMPFHFAAWRTVFKQTLGLDIVEKDVYLREGQKGAQGLREICDDYGVAYTEAMGEDLLQKKQALFPKLAKMQFVDGADNFLRYVQEEEFQTALVTGTSYDEVQKLLPKDIMDTFDVIVTATDVMRGKPEPEPFLKAVQLLRVNPSLCVVIENAPLGVSSAKAAGLTCIALETSLPSEYLDEADFIFPSFKDLRRFVTFEKVFEECIPEKF